MLCNCQPKTRMVDGDCKGFLDQLFEANFNTNFRHLNSKILVCLFWSLLEVFVTTMPADVSLVGDVVIFYLFLVYFHIISFPTGWKISTYHCGWTKYCHYCCCNMSLFFSFRMIVGSGCPHFRIYLCSLLHLS